MHLRRTYAQFNFKPRKFYVTKANDIPHEKIIIPFPHDVNSILLFQKFKSLLTLNNIIIQLIRSMQDNAIAAVIHVKQ